MQDNFHRPDDHEAKMARADLFKCAQYSFKLFKMIQEDQELEGWVQAKITKAADYIASVYHYMEYEMKISEYGSAIENSDMYSESIRRAFAQKLTEAKVEAKKAKDEMKKKEKALDEEKSSTGGEIDRSKKGVTKHKENPNRFSDEEHTEPKSQAKSKSSAEKAGDKAHDKTQEKDSKAWGKANPGKQTIMKGGVKTTNEGAKPDFLDMDKDGDKKEPMKKAVKDKKVKEGSHYGNEKLANAKASRSGTSTVVDQDGKGGVKTTTTKTPAKKIKEAAGKCNHTPKGKSCPVHGLKECGGMYEGDKFDPLKHVEKKSQTPPIKQAAKDVDRKNYGDRTALMKAGGVKDDRGPRGVKQG